MDCARFEELLHDLDRKGTQAALRESALAHAESCGRCARLLTESEALDFSLRALAVEDGGQQAPARVEESLLREFRRQKAAASRRRIGWRLAVLGAAAAAALAVGIWLRHAPVPGTKSTGTEQAGTIQPGASQGNAAQTAEQPAASQDDSEYATAFVSLPYADDSAMADGGAVVRVVLSRSALASLGVPVADAGNTNPIPADIVVSEDGTPQAIRLVSQASVN
ncbi:MAG: hypothetical protein ACLQMT_10675 [Candidatus Acidiferrales bacterium]